jgi:hypothetical protein
MIRPGELIAIVIGLLVFALSAPSAAAQHRAVAVAASEPNLGVSVLREDGRVVSFTGPDELEGPVVIPGLDRVIAITARTALRDDGSVLTWEPHCYRDDQCEVPPRNVRRVARLHDVVAISEANGFYLAVDKDGSVWGWGNDEDGLISGLPPLDQSKIHKVRSVNVPVRIPLPVPMVAVSAGYVQAGAVDRDGNAWTWGGHRFPRVVAAGEQFTMKQGLVAVRVAGLPPVFTIDVFSSPYVVWAWGDVPATTGSVQTTVPMKIAGATGIVALSQSYGAVAMLTKGGTVFYLGPSAPDDQFSGDTHFEPRATVRTPPAAAISGAARITADGALLYFLFNHPQAPKRVDIGK